MNTETQTIPMTFLDNNLFSIKYELKGNNDNWLSDGKKEEFAQAVDLLNDLLEMHIRGLEDERKGNEFNSLRFRVSQGHKLALIKLITDL